MKKLSVYILSICAAASVASCNKLLETNPRESIDLEKASKSKDAIKATVISAYASMRAVGYYGRDFIVQSEVLSDNGEITTSNSNRFVNESNNSPRAQVAIWNTCYTNIFRSNFIMKYGPRASGFSEEELDQLMGEAFFIRAYNYFDLVRSFARNPRFLNGFDYGVPIVTDALLDVTNPEFPGYPSRPKVDAVYAQIVKDLDSAVARLGKSEVTAGIVGPFRASKLAAIALNSRVKLYRGDWAGSEADATTAIGMIATGFNTPKLKVEFVSDSATYMSKWGNLHPEMIFGLSFEAYEAFGSDAIQSIFYKHPILGGYGDITPRAGLRADYYTDNDPRWKSLLRPVTKSGQAIFSCLKWPGAKPFQGGDDIMLIRASELYLNRAEARAMQGGKDVEALDDLNKVHTRVKLAPLAGLTGDALTAAILRERRIELAFEGHRLFDLMRTGRDIVKSAATTIPNTDYKLVAPIPQAEVDVNKNLLQNPNY
ncbi:RagB/SusD family nutrient uptake outer membrane protein [Chitinophaga lutea]|uniref:RagB/SusD family nutrient uptake outer membrane protein n=1 Tax=Chitinophaga lutea TaxID=2488634 RepID=A0A3N4PLB0_9BACT|nr:RagB/SusD family nutrient uptake outer membrane protein [Chitinophaga lutea]RPE08585.1 RagB/SusD family nutrient uptake outer membrane protein [Chitinophaga lutea]